METQTIKTNTSELSVKIQGTEKNGTIVLLHGGPGVPDYLEDVALALNGSYRVISFDQRGVGRSVAHHDSYSTDDYINDIHAIIHSLNLSEFHFFGHSWGALLAELYAKKYADNIISMFLCNPCPGIGKYWLLMEKDILDFFTSKMSTSEWVQLKYNYYIAHQGMAHADRAMIKIILLLWQTYFKNLDLPKKRTKEWLHGINAKALFKTRKSIMNKSHLSLNELPAINSIPILVLYGTDDIYQSTKWITRARFPNAQYIELENSGHFPWLQDNENFMLILSQFYEI